MAVKENFQAFMANGGLVCPPGKSKIEYGVSDEPNLFVECRASRKAIPTWYLRLKNERGSNTYRKLGTVKELSLAQARKLAQQIKAEHAKTVKVDRSIALAPAPAEMTWSTFIANHVAPFCKAHIRSAKRYDQLERGYVCPRVGHLPLSQITLKHAQLLHVDMVEKEKLSPATADHAIKYMRRALNLAVQWDYLQKNPLKSFELFKVDNQVENYLNEEQLQRLLTVLRTDPNRTVCHILMLLLSTGARANEAMTATWKNISVESRVWKVDAVRSKSKRSRSIPLNDSALWVIGQLDTQLTSEYLFPSPITGLPYLAITRPWYRLRKKAGVKIRIHDLRHGFASMLVSSGRSLYEVQQILGHSDPKVTMRYAHLSSKALQEAANAGSVIVPRAEPKAA